MHGSMGGERRPATVGYAARRQAPLAYPTILRLDVQATLPSDMVSLAMRRNFSTMLVAIAIGVVVLWSFLAFGGGNPWLVAAVAALVGAACGAGISWATGRGDNRQTPDR